MLVNFEKNIFFDERKIKHLGKNVIIGKSVRIRHPEFFSIGDLSIIDDFTYISTKFSMGINSHISSNVTMGGGKGFTFTLGNYCGISVGVTVWCVTDEYVKDMIGTQDKKVKKQIVGNVTMEDFTGIGSNSVIMPNVTFKIGSTLGAFSMVRPNIILEPWTFYAGIPVKPIKKEIKNKF